MIRALIEQLAMYIPLIIGGYISLSLLKMSDLSLESAFTMGAMMSGHMFIFLHQYPSIVSISSALLVAIISGSCVGLWAGFCSQYLRISHLLAAIATNGICYGLIQLLAGVYMPLSAFAPITPGYPSLILILSITMSVMICIAFMLYRQWGYAWTAYGNNPLFFMHYGISTRTIVMSGLCIANACAGISGFLVALQSGFAELHMGLGKIVFIISALILAKSIRRQFKASLSIPLLGASLFLIGQQLLLRIGLSSSYFISIQAIIILIFLAASQRTVSKIRTQTILGV